MLKNRLFLDFLERTYRLETVGSTGDTSSVQGPAFSLILTFFVGGASEVLLGV